MKIRLRENQSKPNLSDVNTEPQSKIPPLTMTNIYMQIASESKHTSSFSPNSPQQLKNVGLGELKEIRFRFQVKAMDNNKRHTVDEISSSSLVFLSFFKLPPDHVLFRNFHRHEASIGELGSLTNMITGYNTAPHFTTIQSPCFIANEGKLKVNFKVCEDVNSVN